MARGGLLVACAVLLFAGTQIFAVDVAVDVSKSFQTIDGFGFFGCMRVWWGGGDTHNAAWLDAVVDDLGITIWRNEYFSEEGGQDANWAEQEPFVRALKAKADASGVNIKFIYTVWTPPSAWKSNQSLKNGGHLLPAHYNEYAQWLIDGVKKYADAGVNLYALSPQNEPGFEEFYNSCVYTQDEYKNMLTTVGPLVHAAYPNVKIFGAEDMLDAGLSRVLLASLQDSTALSQLDILAFHNYSDGVHPIAQSTAAVMWTQRGGLGKNMNKPVWMTETSGYSSWKDYAYAMFIAQYTGNCAGWVHWQGIEEIISGTTLTDKGNVLKHWARYVRPGAVRVGTPDLTEQDLGVTAYVNAQEKTMSIVILNTGSAATLNFTGVPAQMTKYESTNGSAISNNGSVSTNSVSVPGSGMVTLVATNYEGGTGAKSATVTHAAFRPAQQLEGVFSLDGRLSNVNNAHARGVYFSVYSDKQGRVVDTKRQILAR